MTQGFGAAMKCGVTKEQLDNTIGIHPTCAEVCVCLMTKLKTIALAYFLSDVAFKINQCVNDRLISFLRSSPQWK